MSFKDCINVTKINYIDFEKITNITSLFESCASLEEINISDYSKLKPGLGSRTFYGCTNLRDITINNLDLSDIDNINYGISEMFSNCNKLQYVVFNYCNFSNVTNMSYMFNNCRELVNVSFNNCIYDIEYEDRTLNMSYMFNKCSNLLSADLSNFLIVGTLKETFAYCENLKRIIFSSKNNTVTNFNSTFTNCKSLEYINLDNFDVSNCDDFSQMFYASKLSCDLNLTSFEINYSAKTTNMLNFANHGHRNVYVTNSFNKTEEECNYCCEFKILTLASIYNIHKFIESDANYVPDSVKNSIYITRDNILGNNIIKRKLYLLDEDINNLTFEVIPRLLNGGTLAYDCPIISIEYVNIKSDRTSLENMFKHCFALEYINMENTDLSNITNYNSCFYECESLKSLNLNNCNTGNIKDTSHMFYVCRSLISLDLSNFDTSNVTNMECMFHYCRSLESLDVSSFDTSNVTNMHYMFYNCESLTSLDLSSFTVKNTNTEDMLHGVTCNVIIDPNKFLKTERECDYHGETFVRV